MFLSAIRQQFYITKLHRKGCRTDGTLTAMTYEDHGHNHISYQADGKDYKCKTGQKFDLVSAISDTVVFSVLEAVFIGSTIYVIICFI